MSERVPDHDCYDILGVAPDADTEEIVAAFRRLSSFAQGRFLATIADAYDTLRDPGRRAAHDRAHGRSTGAATAGRSPSAGGPVPVLPEPGAAVLLVVPGSDDAFETEVVGADGAVLVVAGPSRGKVRLLLGPGREVLLEHGSHRLACVVRAVRRPLAYELEVPALAAVRERQAGGAVAIGASGNAATPRVQRRSHVRLPILLVVRLADQAGDAWLPARSLDVSAGGLSLVSSERWRPDQVLDVRLALPFRADWLEVEARARVVRVSDAPLAELSGLPAYHYGLAFDRLTTGQQDRIAAAVLWAQTQRPR